MKTAPFVRKVMTQQELQKLNASEIKREVLSGQPVLTLQQQRAARESRGIIGRLERSDTPQDVNDVMQALSAFVAQFPQVIHDDSQDAVENGKRIGQWLKARRASYTTANFTACLNDIFQSLVFDAARIGLSKYGHRITGDTAVRSMPSKDFETLLKPYTGDTPKAVELMDAETYKRTHPEGWSDLRKPAADMELAYVKDSVDKFKQLAPEYVSSDANAQMLIKETVARGLRINQASLLLVFQDLVRDGKMRVNESVSIKAGSTTRTDFKG